MGDIPPLVRLFSFCLGGVIYPANNVLRRSQRFSRALFHPSYELCGGGAGGVRRATCAPFSFSSLVRTLLVCVLVRHPRGSPGCGCGEDGFTRTNIRSNMTLSHTHIIRHRRPPQCTRPYRHVHQARAGRRPSATGPRAAAARPWRHKSPGSSRCPDKGTGGWTGLASAR